MSESVEIKNSNLDWLSSIPTRWAKYRLANGGEFLKGRGIAKSDLIDSGHPAIVYGDIYTKYAIATDTLMHYISTETAEQAIPIFKGDLLFTASGETKEDIGRCLCYFGNETAYAGGDIIIYRQTQNDSMFLSYVFNSFYIDQCKAMLAKGGIIVHIYASQLKNIIFPLPPVQEQLSISGYLDRETARIDRLIDAKQRLLDILEEKRRAMVLTAVTRGLDAGVELRNSGVKWLGAVPVHWEVVRLATLFDQIDERGGEGLPLLEVSIKRGVAVREFSDDRIEGVAADVNSYKIVRAGELAFNKMRMWQGAVGIAPADGLVSPDYTVATIAGPILPDFAEYLFRTDAFSAECARHSRGLTWDRLRIYWDGFREISIALPPIKEQEDILTHLKNEASSLNQLGQAAEKSINLLQERRAALITAAVTGQLELSEA